MIELRTEVEGDPVTIYVVEHREDLDDFHDFIRANKRCLAADTETTGLDIYSDTFQCRLVQFGNANTSYILPVEIMGPQGYDEVAQAFGYLDKVVFQNASYDLQVLDRVGIIKMEEMWPKILDTKIMAQLVDPRPATAGGFGHSLEELIKTFISEEMSEDIKGSMARLAREHKTTKDKIWRSIDLFHPEYLTYAGMDTVFTTRVCQALAPLIPDVSRPLVGFEHEVAEICSYVDRKGFLLDVDYSQELSQKWLDEKAVWEAILFTEFGLDNSNSNEQVADVVEETGWKIKGRTDSGKRKVDKSLFEGLAEGDETQQLLGSLIQESQKLGKWNNTWVAKFLSVRDSDDRCHTSINPLQARTSRMSITGIPAQTLPAGDATVRRCFLAEPGHVMASIDYQTQELRVLAAKSGDRTMLEAFRTGADLHQMTADAAKVGRKTGKMANFLTVYGGGPAALAEQANIPYPTAKRTLDAFANTYPGVALYSKRLAEVAAKNGYIVNSSGRRLPVDASRSYSALNYDIQSESRDVTCRALIRLHRAGFTPYIRLPIHDEIVASVPAQSSEWGSQEIARLMSEDMGPVHIGTEPEVGKRSWGSLYGADY